MHTTPTDVTDNAILNGRLHLLQPKRGHRFGHDAILLAAAVPAQGGERVAEFGAGVGAASLALLARLPDISATLFEIDATLCALARENIVRNHLSQRARVVHRDVTAGLTADPQSRSMEIFHHVFMNPPFNDATLQASPDSARRQAHAADDSLLQTWVRQASRMLYDNGALTLIWRAEGLESVLAALKPCFPGASVIPIYPAPDRAAIRIIVRGYRSGARGVSILPSLTLNNRDLTPSHEAEQIMRHLGPWPPEVVHAKSEKP